MAKFCTKCGKRLEEGEICTCDQVYQPQNQQGQPNGQYYQQGQPYGDPNYQQGQPNGQYYQQGQPYGDPNYQQGQPNGQYYQQGQPYGDPNYQQGQPNGQYYQQGQQPYGNPYNQQGMTKEAEWFNQKKDALLAGTKNMFSEILPILKAPVSRVRQLAESNNSAVGMEFIITKMVLFLLLLLIVILKVKDAIGFAGDYVKIPYFKMIVLTLILTVGADFLEALLLKAFTALFNGATHFNAMLSVVGARTLYESLMVLVTAVLLLISPTLALGFFGFSCMILPYIEFGGYQAAVQCDENKKPYAFFLVKLCMTIIIAVLAGVMAGGIVTSLAGGLSELF